MVFKNFSFKWWWYGQVEDLHAECAKQLRDLEEEELKKGHGWQTPKENLPTGWYSVALESLHEYSESSLKGKKQKKQPLTSPYSCIWDSPQHIAIRCLYGGKIFQRRLSYIPQTVGLLGGLIGIASFIMQFITK